MSGGRKMPKAITYKSNSVVYFAGDFDDRVFLLQTGSIALTSVDIETGGQVTNYIKEGEFFGVKSALGGFAREDNAIVLTNSVCLAFQTQEFESFAQSNSRIILQMIKVFSKQLRSIHKKLASLLDSTEDVSPEDGLFSVISTFYNSQHYDAASQVCIRYIQDYPQGKYKNDIIKILQNAKNMQGHSFGVNMTQKEGAKIVSTGPSSFSSVEVASSSASQNISAQEAYHLGQKMFESGNPNEAYKNFQKVIDSDNAAEDIKIDSYIKAGRSLFDSGEYSRSIQLLIEFIRNFQKSPRIVEALVYVGLCYERMDKKADAATFYERALSYASPPMAQKIKELQANLASSSL